ncbi:MAG: hypothetical protein CSA49_06435 [Gammaproteobacteria bacterium]|nr:MAG: hypothetical protein CSA49_06435 [Gammaproteobacteria bacterium]
MKKLLAAFSIRQNFRYLISRPSTNYNVIDGMRAISMLMILLFHAYTIYIIFTPGLEIEDMLAAGGYAWAWIINSDKSVDVFFVISGFLITHILLRQIASMGRIRLSNFYVRRFLRLSPVYYFVIILYWLLLRNLPAANSENIWANFLYVNNFLHYKDQAMNWTWTLAIEEQFYLLFPLLLGFLTSKTKSPLFWMWMLWLLAIVVRYFVIMGDEQISTSPQSRVASDLDFHAHHFSVLYDNLYTRYSALLSGCMAAYYYFYHREAVSRFFAAPVGKVVIALGIGTVFLFLIVPVISQRFDEYQNFNIFYQAVSRNLFSLGLAIWILAAFEEGWVKKVSGVLLGNRLLYPIAQLSYSMYLVHVVLIIIVVTWAKGLVEQNPEISHFTAISYVFLISFVLTTLLAVIMYLLIERPLMNLRK